MLSFSASDTVLGPLALSDTQERALESDPTGLKSQNHCFLCDFQQVTSPL